MGIEVGHPVGAQELHGCGRKPLYTKEMSVLELNSPSNISTSVSPSLPQRSYNTWKQKFNTLKHFSMTDL